MIIDTSALLAILLDEPDAGRYEDAIVAAWPRRMSAIALLEAAMVVESRSGAKAGHELDVLLEKAEVELVPVTSEHVNAARLAWRRFGKGNHRAALNFGDCFAYALAKTTGEPLLFKGEDFTHTDVEPA
ncbi:MAG: type II toxin-antitoxin system VapC family toxin [Nitrospira sp. SB0677_bin_15]|nr:type II toxin-antitoxin system VapC family toxin [Nitrospira sp. SB0667_bin_9]MYD30984.1 type II toxin-antitoxin system VapC family toxin [Nitrospira sp. SB0661_bin_20]MYG40263.1 type II toxin-antitoxin system VapC family toxin [Nitrospira sp. SB0677_bin_15]MYH01452.1 type II toxin-antitoxin system VapC family toxin [Nitrospira sp. SB0675_bin_23]MYJ23905.1 type II toxin-antitoxin system VapC family toxin [Nitrospira sp. SB0673_bin_12]